MSISIADENLVNRIPAPNYTQIPNVVFDYWMNVLSPAEFKVLLCICRKTFGWWKNTDKISLKQIESMTGLSRKGIITCIDSLIEKHLVVKTKSKTEDGDDAPNRFAINVYCMEGGSELSTPQVVNSVHQGVVNSVHPQKKDYTKENITKDTAQTAAPLRKIASQIFFSPEQRKFLHISELDISQWKETYPSIDIDLEIKKMVEWCLSNEKKSSSKRLWRKFITSWLSNANEKAINQQAYRSNTQSKTPTSSVDANENKRISCIAEAQFKSNHWRIELFSDRVEFVPTGPQGGSVDIIKFTDHGFRDQLECLLKKRGFSKKPI